MIFNLKPLKWKFEGNCIRCTSHALSGRGYPMFRRNNVSRTIARHIVLRRHGKLPRDIVSRHTCDNRWCINPDHLIIGTKQDNANDMVSRGRLNPPMGERNRHAKLKEADVLKIRNSSESVKTLATRYGMSSAQISAVRAKKNWRHL